MLIASLNSKESNYIGTDLTVSPSGNDTTLTLIS